MCKVGPLTLFMIYLFVKPNKNIVKNVAAFIYGNGVPVDTAVVCFIACIGLDSYYVSRAINYWYSIWDNNPYTAHFARYCSMNL